MPFLYRRLYWELNSNPFVGLLEKITGIAGLLADPHLAGGGVYNTSPGGYLRVHADFNKHPQYGLDRRLNLLIYLNEDWLPQYGGDLELWSENMESCIHRIAPIAGRCVVFRTTSTSFHGHPHPLTCPDDRSRRSIALYYYSNGRPAEEGAREHGTLWQDRPPERASRLPFPAVAFGSLYFCHHHPGWRLAACVWPGYALPGIHCYGCRAGVVCSVRSRCR